MQEIEQVFADVGCTGAVCVEAADGAGQIAVNAKLPVVAASVIKVLIAVTVERQFVDGSLDPTQRVHLPAGHRSPGPIGFSLYNDDVNVSARDLVVAMLTISDNVATDAIIDLVGRESCNRTAIELGLQNTVLMDNMAGTMNSIAATVGYPAWQALVEATSQMPTHETAAIETSVRGSAALMPETATRTTASDMCALLRAIWSDLAAPPDSCRRIRHLMARQLTRDRLAAAFPAPAEVAAKSGGLLGVVRNEIGVIDYSSGRRFFAAVFTQQTNQASNAAQINTAIGRAAALAVNALADLNQT